MRVTTTIRLDLDVAQWLEEKRRSTGRSYAQLINFYLRKAIKEEEPQIVKCPKCGAEYSSKLKECPNCLRRELEKYDQLGENGKTERAGDSSTS